MALQKGIENLYGIKFDYHRITDVHIIIADNGIQLRMTTASYADEEARRSGKEPIKTVNIIDNADFALTPFYMLLKAKFADFADAKDVFEEKAEPAGRVIYTQQTQRGKLISQKEENAGSATEGEIE